MKSIRFFVIGLVLCIAAIVTEAASWKGGEGNWSSDNWYDSEPTANDSAVIWNGTAAITETGEICKSLQLGGASNFNGHVAISSGSLEVVNTMQIGPVGYGTVNMTGGLLKVNTIVLSQDRYNPSSITISGDAEIQSYYFKVGWPGIGYVTQNGGTITTNELALTNSNDRVFKGEGYYTMNSGTLNAGAVYVGIYKGEFKVTNPGVTINITDGFDIRYDGTFLAPSGTVLHLKGAKFACQKLASSEIPDLANLTLSIEPRGGYESKLEALGADPGAIPSVLTDNFAFDTITIESGTCLRLINNMDNNRSVAANDVAVTRQLKLSNGSTLFLNGINMYCQDWVPNCGSVDWNDYGKLYVLNASYDMMINTDLSEIPADGQSECEISTVLSDRGAPICNANIRFNTNKGTFVGGNNPSAFWARTDAGGRANGFRMVPWRMEFSFHDRI